MASYPLAEPALSSLIVQYAKELRRTGGADAGARDTDLTRPLGREINRTAAQGAAIAVRLALLPTHCPTGNLFNDEGRVPW